MKKMIYLTLLCSCVVSAKPLNCSLDIANSYSQAVKVESSLDQKVFIAGHDSVRTYVTEKTNGLYVVEAFVGEYEVRVYGEGHLSAASDRVATSLWGRDTLIDVKCTL